MEIIIEKQVALQIGRPQAGSYLWIGLIFVLLKRSAFTTTDTELKLIASAAIIGDNNKPNTG